MSDPTRLPADVEVRLVRYRSGAMNPDDRAAFEREALASDVLAEALYGELSLDQVREETANAPLPFPAKLRNPGSRLPTHVLLPIAAAVMLVSAVMLWQQFAPHTPGDVLRGERTLRALEPSGEVAGRPTVFRWTSDPRASSYRVELYEFEKGAPIGSVVTRDTVVAFTAVTQQSGIRHASWRVTPIDAQGLDLPERSGATFEVRLR